MSGKHRADPDHGVSECSAGDGTAASSSQLLSRNCLLGRGRLVETIAFPDSTSASGTVGKDCVDAYFSLEYGSTTWFQNREAS